MDRVKLVLFDVDGTLVDSQQLIVASMKAAFDAVAADMPGRTTLLSVVGLSLPIVFEILAGDLDPEEQAKMVAAYREAYFRLRGQDQIISGFYEGAREALDHLAGHDDIVLGIATGKSSRGVEHMIDHHRLEGVFQTIQTADHHPSKPHPSMIWQAMQDCGVGPAETVMIGDTTFDMEMARAAGVSGLGVSWGYHSPEALGPAGAAKVVDDFSALLVAVRDMWGTR